MEWILIKGKSRGNLTASTSKDYFASKQGETQLLASSKLLITNIAIYSTNGSNKIKNKIVMKIKYLFKSDNTNTDNRNNNYK